MRFLRKRIATAEHYVALFVEKIRRFRPDLLVTKTDQFDISIVDGGDRRHSLSLYNAYAEYVELEDSLEVAIDRRVAASIAAFENEMSGNEFRRDNILPIVRSYDYIQNIVSNYEDQEADCDIIYEEICHPLFRMFCHFQNDNMTLLGSAQLRSMGVDEAFALSVKNLRLKFPAAKILPLQETDDVHFIAAGGTFECSFLLDFEFWNEASKLVGNDIIAIAPSRSTVWFSGKNNPEMKTYLSRAANHFMENEHYPLARDVLTRTKDGWAVIV